MESLFSGPTEVKRIGLVINPALEQFDKFSASVEIQDDSLALVRSMFGRLHAGNLICGFRKARAADRILEMNFAIAS